MRFATVSPRLPNRDRPLILSPPPLILSLSKDEDAAFRSNQTSERPRGKRPRVGPAE